MSDLLEALSAAARAKVRKRAQPRRARPMLAVLTDEPFSDAGWIFERKLDGVRCLVSRRGSRVRLLSRSGKTMNATWPELVDAIARQRRDDFLADGEIVAFSGACTSFARLQGRLGLHDEAAARRSPIAAYLYLFDLLRVDGADVTRVPQRERKALLKRALSFGRRLRYTPHRNEEGELLLKEACRKGWEGLIAKDANAPYVQRRSRSWLKLKCVNRQELVIAGFTPPRGSRRGFGALLVGHYEDGELRYAGKVGTGYDVGTLRELRRRLGRLERDRSPFADPVRESGARFARPELVGEFAFTEWTRDGKLRHPRFLGLRTDKQAREVRRERPGT